MVYKFVINFLIKKQKLWCKKRKHIKIIGLKKIPVRIGPPT